MPNVPEARLNLGIALKTQGRRSEAIAQFREVLRQSPNNVVALQQIQQLGVEPAVAPAD
jgi:cytochrome c-type biogenesis protein CcmH/NrfG